VTGSHLAPHLTGLKLSASPRFLPIDIRTLPPPNGAPPSRGRVRPLPGGAEEHARAVARAVAAEAIRSAGLRVSLLGGAGESAQALLAELGCDGSGAPDVRLKLDADGDRLGLADVDTECILPLVALARPPRMLVRSEDTSRMVDRLLAGHARVRAVPPGELYLVEALIQEGDGQALAGEGNGGVVIPEVGLARDGLATAARILELVAISGRPLGDHLARLPRLARRRSTVRADASEPVSVERGDGLWGLVRSSATEPVVRITVEGPDPAEVDALHDELLSSLRT
jgi:phosphomannomutase